MAISCRHCGESNIDNFFIRKETGKPRSMCKRCHNDKQRQRYSKKMSTKEGWIGRKCAIAKKRAETKQFKFNLTPAYLYTLFEKQNGLCALTGRCLTFHKSNGKGTMDRDSASIDRIDSGKGYIQGNVQWVCSFANIMKQRFTNQEFIKLCKDVVRYNT